MVRHGRADYGADRGRVTHVSGEVRLPTRPGAGADIGFLTDLTLAYIATHHPVLLTHLRVWRWPRDGQLSPSLTKGSAVHSSLCLDRLPAGMPARGGS